MDYDGTKPITRIQIFSCGHRKRVVDKSYRSGPYYGFRNVSLEKYFLN